MGWTFFHMLVDWFKQAPIPFRLFSYHQLRIEPSHSDTLSIGQNKFGWFFFLLSNLKFVMWVLQTPSTSSCFKTYFLQLRVFSKVGNTRFQALRIF